MLLVTLNAVFAAAAFFLAQRAIMRGWPFLRTGWMAVRSQSSQPDFRENVVRRLAISEGGRFLVGGCGWLLIGCIAFAVALYFGLLAYQGMFGSG